MHPHDSLCRGNGVSMSSPSLPAFARDLPIPLTRLLGREREVAGIVTLLKRDDTRLLTLTGPGGVGKTRLALAVAKYAAGDFGDSVAFVGLAAIRDPDLVMPTIAQALGIRDASGPPASEQLAAALGQRLLLLVLDNVEQVIAAAS